MRVDAPTEAAAALVSLNSEVQITLEAIRRPHCTKPGTFFIVWIKRSSGYLTVRKLDRAEAMD